MLLDWPRDAARSILRLVVGAEHEVEAHTPIEQPLHEAITALHHAAESMDRHVEVLEGLAATLPALTGALVQLTEQLGEVLRLAAPLEAAEREVAGIGHLFRRRRHEALPPAQAAAPSAPHVTSSASDPAPLATDAAAQADQASAAAEAEGEQPG